MSPFRAVVAGALTSAVLLASAFPLRAQEPSPIVRDIQIVGARELSVESVREAAHVRAGVALPVGVDRVDDLASRVVNRYHDEGYTFAAVKAAFDAASGVLTFTIDEGVIGGVEFTGVDDRLKRQFAEEFALRAGDVFNRSRA